jgi:hypothetical protein
MTLAALFRVKRCAAPGLALSGEPLDQVRVVETPAGAVAFGWENAFSIELLDATDGQDQSSAHVSRREFHGWNLHGDATHTQNHENLGP